MARGPRIPWIFEKQRRRDGWADIDKFDGSITYLIVDQDRGRESFKYSRHLKLRIGVTYCNEAERRSSRRENYGDSPHHRAYKSSYRNQVGIQTSVPSNGINISNQMHRGEEKINLSPSSPSLVRDGI